MWITQNEVRKWRPESVEARIYAQAEAHALATGSTDEEADHDAMEAVFQVMAWLYSRSYAVVADMIEDAYGVKTSIAALSGFWQRFNGSFLPERMRRLTSHARELAKEVDRDAVTSSTLDLISQQAFDLMSNPEPDPDKVIAFARVLLTAEKQKLDSRRVALLETKASQADQAKEVMGSELTEAEKAERMRQIFGMGG